MRFFFFRANDTFSSIKLDTRWNVQNWDSIEIFSSSWFVAENFQIHWCGKLYVGVPLTNPFGKIKSYIIISCSPPTSLIIQYTAQRYRRTLVHDVKQIFQQQHFKHRSFGQIEVTNISNQNVNEWNICIIQYRIRRNFNDFIFCCCSEVENCTASFRLKRNLRKMMKKFPFSDWARNGEKQS